MTAVIGQRLLRREDASILTGEARYIDDLAVPGALWFALVRSPHAHARILSIDTSAAPADPDVMVFTGADLQSDWASPMPCASTVTPDMKNPPHYPVAVEKAKYVGDAVAVVVAKSRQQAVDALVQPIAESLTKVDGKLGDLERARARAPTPGVRTRRPDWPCTLASPGGPRESRSHQRHVAPRRRSASHSPPVR
jgi:carbon-monoxide dehydrogenase large subunit